MLIEGFEFRSRVQNGETGGTLFETQLLDDVVVSINDFDVTNDNSPFSISFSPLSADSFSPVLLDSSFSPDSITQRLSASLANPGFSIDLNSTPSDTFSVIINDFLNDVPLGDAFRFSTSINFDGDSLSSGDASYRSEAYDFTSVAVSVPEPTSSGFLLGVSLLFFSRRSRMR